MSITAFSTMSTRPDLRPFLPLREDNDPVQSFLRRLEAIKMISAEFDGFCGGQPHILRNLRGHAFEVWFDELMARSGYDCREVGGDEVTDRTLNGHTLQLKTPHWRGTTQDKTVAYRMHKTHGRERHPEALYLPGEFADFFVGLHPDGNVIICPADELTTRRQLSPRAKWGEYIADPLPFDWDTKWLNRYDLLGIDHTKLVFQDTSAGEILPRISKAIGYSDLQIIKGIMSDENFRVWNQLIVGSVREFHFTKSMARFKRLQGIARASLSQWYSLFLAI